MKNAPPRQRRRQQFVRRWQAMLKPCLCGLVLTSAITWQDAAAQTLHQAVEGAWALNPQVTALTARRNEFIARRKAAGAWFPAPPAVTLSHLTDQAIVNRQQRDTEIELSAPLWLPGESTATRQVARADLRRNDAQLALVRLTVAGEVRRAVYRFALAEREAGLADRRVENARALESDVARRVSAGDVAALEDDQARGELLDAQANARERQAQVSTARAALLTLTGLRTPPLSFEEPLAAERNIARHPRLEVAERRIAAAQAALRLTEIATRDSPQIGAFAGRNRDIFGTVYDTTIGVRFRLPFATEARNAPRQAAAIAEVEAAEAEYAAAEREIRVEVATAQQELAAAEAESPLVGGRLQALRSALARLQGSYSAGEIGFIEVLRARIALFDAEVAQARNRLAIGQARARINQALGVIP